MGIALELLEAKRGPWFLEQPCNKEALALVEVEILIGWEVTRNLDVKI